MSSNKMSPRTQVKKNKNQKITDKTDKAMSDIKKIGIISCCLIAILIVIGLFVDTEESYAADFLASVPDQFTSKVSDPSTGMQTLIRDTETDNYISLPKEFSGTTADGTFISYIYCMDRRLGMPNNHLYTKGNSVKAQSDIAPDIATINTTADYPGLLYILQNHGRLGGNAEENYYYTQIAVWWYVDRANGFADDTNYSITTGEPVTDIIEDSFDDKYDDNDKDRFINNLSVLDKQMLNRNAMGQTIKQLVDEAVANEGNYPQNSGIQDIIIDQSAISYTMSNNYVETSVIRPTSNNINFDSYSIQINDAVGNVEIIDENGNPLDPSSISASTGFKLRVPLADVASTNFKANITITGYFKDYYDAYIYNPENNNAQRALLGQIEQPSISTALNLEAPTIDTPDTSNNSFLVYGIGALIIVTGIILIIVANKNQRNAKKK